VKRAFWRTPVQEEVDAELAFHLEMTTRELMERGMTKSQARGEAERRFGDVNSVNADCRRFGDQRDRRAERAEYWGELRQDCTFTLRQLAKSRGFSTVAILTLALGIGATAAVFSALDAVVLRPLPFGYSERIVEVLPTRRGEIAGASAPEFIAHRNSHVFEHVAGAVLGSGITLKFGDVPEVMTVGRVSSEFFDVFNVKPTLGRMFNRLEDAPGGSRVTLMSHRLWATRYNEDPNVLGRPIELDGIPHTLIGVMPASFDFQPEDLWVPLALTPQQTASYSELFLTIFARLNPVMSAELAQKASTSTERVLAERIPDRTSPVTEWGTNVRPYVEELAGGFGSRLVILLGAVGFVLLIACSNVANLLLARGTSRAKELAIRVALGAGRGRLIRQLLTESLVLAIGGAVLGLGVAYAMVRVIVAVSPQGVPRLEQAGIDWRVLTFTLALGVVSCLLFGLLPALRSVGPRLQTTLREGGRQSRGSGRDPLRSVLVATEVALAITLLIGSGLLIRSAWMMQHVDPGFDPRGVLTARIMLPAARYADAAAITRTYETIREHAAGIPGVSSAAVISIVPMSGSQAASSVLAEGHDEDAVRPQANLRLVGPGYFATMASRFVAGRDVTRDDNASAPLVVIVNKALAEKLWPGVAPRAVIGKRLDALRGKKSGHLMEVVGVVADVHEESLEQTAKPAFYVPIEQTPENLWPLIQRSLVVVIRSANPSIDADALVRPLRRAVAQVDPSLPLADSRSMISLLKGSLEAARMNTILLSMLGGIALLLAVVGIYGVVSYFVTQRTHEIGVRIALGATPSLIWKFVVRRGLTPIVAGLVVGLFLSSITMNVLRGQLYGVGVHDPLTQIAVGVLLGVVGLLATYIPARRAMRVPPVVALQEG